MLHQAHHRRRFSLPLLALMCAALLCGAAAAASKAPAKADKAAPKSDKSRVLSPGGTDAKGDEKKAAPPKFKGTVPKSGVYGTVIRPGDVDDDEPAEPIGNVTLFLRSQTAKDASEHELTATTNDNGEYVIDAKGGKWIFCTGGFKPQCVQIAVKKAVRVDVTMSEGQVALTCGVACPPIAAPDNLGGNDVLSEDGPKAELSKTDIVLTLKDLVPKVMACKPTEDAAKASKNKKPPPPIPDVIPVKLMIEKTGKPSHVRIDSNDKLDKKLAACILKAVEGVRFPSFTGKPPAEVLFPVKLNEAAADGALAGPAGPVGAKKP